MGVITLGTILCLKQIIQKTIYNTAQVIRVISDAKNGSAKININVITVKSIIINKFNRGGNFIINSLCRKLSSIVACISTPGWVKEIEVSRTSSTPIAFAPTNTILLSNSDGDIIGFLPSLICLFELIISIAE